VYSKFVRPLPSSIKEFALSFHKIFPHIADTRHLMSVNQAVQKLMKHKSKSLSSAFLLLCPASYSSVEKPSSHSPVTIEVEGDETMYGLSGSLIFDTCMLLITFDTLAQNFFGMYR
jgi:poly(A)-specific ribonuclease